jgi:cell wall-associated NlpC family hydrolase
LNHLRVNALRPKKLMLSLAAVGLLAVPASAAAETGAVSSPSGGTTTTSTPTTSGPVGKATLNSDGSATAPSNAPMEVQLAIAAANQIKDKPYIWGGGHRRWEDNGYDCSGSVSYVLHAAGLLNTPLASGALMKWGKKGKSSWITVFANGGHTYARIAGLRWDTSGTGGSGPGWSKKKRSGRSFAKRHWSGL